MVENIELTICVMDEGFLQLKFSFKALVFFKLLLYKIVARHLFSTARRRTVSAFAIAELSVGLGPVRSEGSLW